ncbi:MAG: GNAT family N-acetyltransferase [Dysgonamonadaceae bacterium]
MEFRTIELSNIKKWNEVWQLYEDSFPLAERRKLEDHIRACADPMFHPISAWEGSQLIGLLFYWEWNSYRYLEYLAVNPDLRKQGLGSQILRHLKDTTHSIILEIDPLINELSVRRLQFYERAGFMLTPFRFMHLPYRMEGRSQELLMLSYPKTISKEQHLDFLEFVNKYVIKYCDGYPFEDEIIVD